MNEAEFWSHLEFRICREMDGVDECQRLGLWCDGLIPRDYVLEAASPHIVGRAWVCFGPKQEKWEFRLGLLRPVRGREEINWREHVPGDDVTQWLKVDLGAKQLEIEPAAAICDAP